MMWSLGSGFAFRTVFHPALPTPAGGRQDEQQVQKARGSIIIRGNPTLTQLPQQQNG